jgi:hypothetical protein
MKCASASVLLVTAALVLAVAPSALASHATEISVQEGTLGPGGSMTVTYTVQCTEGYQFVVDIFIRQKSGKTFNFGGRAEGRTCLTTGPETYTTDPFFGQGPFKSGRAVAESSVRVCDPEFFDCASDGELKEIRIRK